jgi:hypothetical protein
MVILKIEGTAAVDASAAVALKDRPPNLPGDGLTLATRSLLPALLDVEQCMRAIQVLGGTPLTVTDERNRKPRSKMNWALESWRS